MQTHLHLTLADLIHDALLAPSGLEEFFQKMGKPVPEGNSS